MNIKQFGILVDRYLSGKASATEINAIDQWLNQSGENVKRLTDPERVRLQNELLQKIRQAMPSQAALQRGALMGLIRPYLRIAAVLAAFIGLLWFYQFKGEHKPEAAIAYETYRTPKGLKAMLTLSDGSVIQLNAATVVKYPRQFHGATRAVYLEEGEAFFEITPNPKKPFIVHTAQQIETRVLGTSFNISSYQASGQLTISVNTGRVKVSQTRGKSKKTIGVFTPGQGITYLMKAGQFTQAELDATELAAWKNNILVLKDADFNVLKQRLENWYGIEVSLQAQAVPSALFTGRFFNKSLHEVLHALQRINKFQYELTGNKLKIDNQIKQRKSERKPM